MRGEGYEHAAWLHDLEATEAERRRRRRVESWARRRCRECPHCAEGLLELPGGAAYVCGFCRATDGFLNAADLSSTPHAMGCDRCEEITSGI